MISRSGCVTWRKEASVWFIQWEVNPSIPEENWRHILPRFLLYSFGCVTKIPPVCSYVSLVWQLRGNNLPQALAGALSKSRARHVFLHAGGSAPELGHGHRRGPPLHPLHEYGGALKCCSADVKPPNVRQFQFRSCFFFLNVICPCWAWRFRSLGHVPPSHRARDHEPPFLSGQRSDRPLDGQHLALHPALLHFRSTPAVLHHQRQGYGQESMDWSYL